MKNKLQNVFATLLICGVFFILPGLAEQLVEIPIVLEVMIKAIAIIAIVAFISMLFFLAYIMLKPEKKVAKKRPKKTQYCNPGSGLQDWKNKRIFEDIIASTSNIKKKSSSTNQNLVEKVNALIPNGTEAEKIQLYAELQKKRTSR